MEQLPKVSDMELDRNLNAKIHKRKPIYMHSLLMIYLLVLVI